MPPEAEEVEEVEDEPGLEDDDSGTPPDSDDVDAAEGTPPEGDGEPPEDKNWKDLRGKYPGLSDDEIRTKVAASYWEQTKALSGAAKRERELELKLARAEGRLEAGTPPEEKTPPPPPPQIQELDTYIHGLKERDDQVAESQTQMLADLSKARDKAGEIKGLIQAAKEANDEDKASRLESRLEVAEGRLERIRGDLNASVEKRKDIAWNLSRAEREKEWLTGVIKESQAREESEREELETTLAEIPRMVDSTMDAVIEAAGMPADPALREDLRETLRSKITIDLWKAKGTPFDKLDIGGMLKQYTDRYMKAHGIAKRVSFKKRSEDATRVAGQPPTKPAAETSPGKPGVKPPRVVSAIGALPPGMLRARRILGQKGY